MSSESKTKIPGPIIAVGLIAVVWAVMEFWPEPTPEEKTPDQAPVANIELNSTVARESGEWSTYHGGPALTGVVEVNLPDAPEVLWRFQANSPVYYPPVSNEGRIFFSTIKGGVFALDLNGNEIWSKHFFQKPYRDGRPRVERFDAPISCFGDTVLVGSMRGLVYAFDTATGDLKWNYTIDSAVLGAINLYDPSDAPGDESVFLIEQGEGILHSIDLKTGKARWKTEAIDRCDGSPSIKDGAIVFGSCAAALHVFSAKDGTLVKNIGFDEDSQVAGGAAIVGESAYVGSHSGRLFSTNLNTGEILWYNEDSYDEIFETPAVDDEFVIFSSYDGNVYALHRETGKTVWTFETDGVPTSPVIASDKVVITSDGIMSLLKRTTGEEIWTYEISDETSSAAIINGMIVVGSDDGTVTAFGKATQ
jgi:outer membrane protein assembly factor BamB